MSAQSFRQRESAVLLQMREIVSLIEREPMLAAQVVEIANSAHYAPAAHSDDIDWAVNRIGLRQVQGLVATIVAGLSCALAPPSRCACSSWWHASSRA